MTTTTSRSPDFFAPLAVKIREAAARIGLSQSDIARAIGTHQATANRWWSGKTIPTREMVAALEDVLELEPGSLRCLMGFLPGDDPHVERLDDGGIIIRLSISPDGTMRP